MCDTVQATPRAGSATQLCIPDRLQIKLWVRPSAKQSHDALDVRARSHHPSIEMFFLPPFSVQRGENKTAAEAGLFEGISKGVNADARHLEEPGIIFL